LKTDVEEGEMSEEAKKAIEGLKTALNKMRPQEKTNNQRELAGQQKNLGEMWRRLNNDKLKELFSHSPQEQQFGSANKEKLEKWTRELQEGSSAALQKEIEEAIEDLQRLEQTTDPVKKAELEQKIRKKLKDLNQFAGDRVGSKPLSAALQRAMQQLEMSRMEGMDPKEAAQAVKESLELSKAELQEIAQSAKDLQKLEESLKIMQMAKQLNEQEKLDGDETEGMGDMGEYEEFYQELIAQLGLSGMEGEGEGEGEGEDGEGEGDGEGMGGRGMGRGRAAPEDDSTESDFRTEQSKSPVTAGKTLMTMKSKGLSQKGDDRAEYRKALEAVKQGRDLTEVEFYLCPVCGYIEFGKPTEACPVCKTRPEKFMLV
jgi:tetratricopeptide (TPR) repeat protein